MKKSINAALALCVVVACAGTTMAQFSARASEAGMVVGGAIPITKMDITNIGGKNEIAVKTGIDFGGRYLYHTSPEWAFGGEVSYAGFGDKEHAASSVVIKVRAGALDIEGVAKYTLMSDKKTRPYLIGGIGYGSLKQKTQTTPKTGYAWIDTGTTEPRTNYDETIGGVGVSFGIGLESFISDTIILGVEGRWKYLGTEKTIDDNVFGGKWKVKSSKGILLTAGISWKFGK